MRLISPERIRGQFAVDTTIVRSKLAHVPEPVDARQFNDAVAVLHIKISQSLVHPGQPQDIDVLLGCNTKPVRKTLFQGALAALTLCA